MKITWLGHSTFKIESEMTIVIDPHDPTVGPLPADLTADIVTVSHAHHDHNYIEGVGGDPQIFDQAGDFIIAGDASPQRETSPDIKIIGVPTFHDGVQGQQRGNNIVFVYDIEGLNLCHLGDLGHLLNPTQLAQIGTVDILMIPVGGFYTIDADQAVEVVGQIKPKIVLPMHYKSKNLPASVPIAPVDAFVTKLGWKVKTVTELDINIESIGEHLQSIILFS